MGSGEKKRKSNNKKKGKEKHEEPMITDERFKAAESDPRFMEVPTKKSKVAVDPRFNTLFDGFHFNSSKARVDKRGKPNKNKRKAASSVLSHYYPEQEEKEKKKTREESEDDVDSEGDEEDLSGSDSEKLKTAVNEDEMSIDVSSPGTDDTTDSESGFESADVEEEDSFEQPVENIPDIDKETRRLAVVNMDWTHVRAVDLFVTLDSFLFSRGGQIMSVTVYPTEFGLKRMEEEAVHGPIGLFSDDEKEKEDDDDEEEDKDNENEAEDDDDDDDDDEKEKESDDDDEDDDEREMESEDEDDVNGIDKKKIRAYELNKLRYYFAVVECDSVATADYLYQTCDGAEFERSGNILDLRFIPDSMEFKHQPRDVATEKPSNYKGLDFHTPALQGIGNLRIEWDEDEPYRLLKIKELLKSDQPAEADLNEVLATDESETDDDDIADVENDKLQKKRKRVDKYLALIQSGNRSDDDDDDDDEEDNDQDMEITFNSGLEDISKRILENKDKKSETVWEATLRKKKEKKKALKKRSKYSSDDESDDYDDADREIGEQPGDFFVEDNQVHGTKAEESIKEAEKSRAELELLLTDVSGEKSKVKGFKLNPKKKGKKDKDDPVEKLPTIDYSDPRFSGLLNNPKFALDPTDPQFKRTAAYAKQVAQKDTKGSMVNVRKADHLVNSDEASEVGEVENLKNDTLAKTKESHELSTLVRSVKMKSKQMPLQSERKVQRNHKLKANFQK